MNRKDIEMINEAYSLRQLKNDWFKFVYGTTALKLAKLTKATPTKQLMQLAKHCETDPNKDNRKTPRGIQCIFMQRELEYRKANGNINSDGDPKYKKQYNHGHALGLPPYQSEKI